MTMDREQCHSKSKPTVRHEGGMPFQWDGVQGKRPGITKCKLGSALTGNSQEQLTERITDDSSISELDAALGEPDLTPTSPELTRPKELKA